MKIEKKFNTTAFKDVLPGAVLRDEDGAIYLKLDYCYKSTSSVLYNAVALDHGSLVNFNDNERVEILDSAILTC